VSARRPDLTGPRVRVRPGEPADIPAILDFYRRNAEFFARTASPRPENLREELWPARLATADREFAADQSCRLFVFAHKAEPRVIGAINFFSFIRGSFHACILGYSLDEQVQGQGLMRESLELAIAFVFRELGMHRIMANYGPQNVRSGALLRRLGFRVEGYAQDYLLVGGVWQDHYLTALTNPDWSPPG
jgi:ribosomal-protein-alanine N-acetyltransferase